VDGVQEITVGYTGGHVPNPTYEQVASGATGHYEAAEIIYDAAKITYGQIVDTFFRNIDPTDDGGQLFDRGSQYLTAVFYTTPEEKDEAERIKDRIATQLNQPVATKILPVATFYPAEDYHQEYYKTNPMRYRLYEQGSGRSRRLNELWNQ
jgi:methionine-S-sulfoxide reductase